MDGAHHQDGLREIPSSRAYAEPWPGGGWAVKLVNHHTPVSRHDTEDEARDKAASYQRGLENADQQVQAATDLDRNREGTGVVIEATLPEQGDSDYGDFYALWREENRGSDHLRRLGHDIQEYEARHRPSAEVLRERGQLGGRR